MLHVDCATISRARLHTNMPWATAAHSCECYHRLSWVTTGYHSVLCPRNSFNPPLAFPAHRSQDALVCNQSVRRTPLWVAHVARGGHGRGFSQSNISSARRNLQVSHCNCLMVTPSLPSCHLQYQCGQEVNLMLSDATRSLIPLITPK